MSQKNPETAPVVASKAESRPEDEVLALTREEWLLELLKKRDAEISFLKAEKMRLERLLKR